MGWPETTADLEKYLPSSVLVTGFDIIFFWVARMIMMSMHMTGKVPFETVYVHGLICDMEGKRMSKSQGNTLDPVHVIGGIDLEKLIKSSTTERINHSLDDKIAARTRKAYTRGLNE